MDGVQILRLWVPHLAWGCTSTAGALWQGRVVVCRGHRAVHRFPAGRASASGCVMVYLQIAVFFAISLATARRLTDAE